MDLRVGSVNPNKLLKEEFVSNLTGTSMLEIIALSVIIPAVVVLRKCSNFGRVNGRFTVQNTSRKKDDDATSSSKDWRSFAISVSMDYLFIIAPLVLFFTVLAEWVYAFAIVLILLLLLYISCKSLGACAAHFKEGSEHLSSMRYTISSYRVSLVTMTCICILAVDFRIFPRRYAKAETYGNGLMDLGVGSFIVANSLVSKQARGLMLTSWRSSLQSISPLLILGFGRLIVTSSVDYQVHVGEYGVHWNFFFTLAAVSMLTTIFNIHPKHCGIFGLLIIIGYQMCLSWGLNTYLISNERTGDIVSQNKEGLFSIFGYWGMYLIGVYLGHCLFFGESSSVKSGTIQISRTKVWLVSILLWFLTISVDKFVERVSRRMCNAAYVLLVFAENFQVLSVLMLSDFIGGQRLLLLEEAFNQNLLASFLLANVLTGLVNLSTDTLSASSFTALSILFVYSSFLTIIVSLAWFYGTKLKFW